MNLAQLWSGNDYAYYRYKGRGETYRRDALRVRIIRTFGEVLEGNTRETGFAEVLLIDDEGEPQENMDGSHKTLKIRARDIAMRWEEYEEEHAEHEAERIEREAEYERQRIERNARYERVRLDQREKQELLERERIERERIKAERDKAVVDRLAAVGITNGMIQQITMYSITIDREAFMNPSEVRESESVG